MKEDLRTLWNYPDKVNRPKDLLYYWIARAEISGIAMLKAFARPCANISPGYWRTTIIQSQQQHLKAPYNKIKTMKRTGLWIQRS